MLFPEKMLRINIKIETNFINLVLESIGETALLHIDKRQHQLINESEASRVKTLLTLVQKAMKALQIIPRKQVVNFIPDNKDLFNEIEEKLSLITKEVDGLSFKIKSSEQELEHYIKASSVNKALLSVIDTQMLSEQLKQLKARVVIMTMDATELLRLTVKHKDFLLIDQPLYEQTNALAIFYEEQDDSEISRIFNTFKAIEISLEYFSTFEWEKQKQIQDQLHQHKLNLAKTYSEQLQEIENFLNAMSELETAKSSLVKVQEGFELEGWIPKKYKKDFLTKIKHAKVIILDEEGEAPVLLETPLGLKAFEKLISGFSYPRYGEINPVIPFAFSFLLLFGIMFGDVGHGLILALAGWVVKKKSEQYTDLGHIFFLSGISSTFIGFLYGSIFGLHHILPPILFSPIENVQMTIILSIGIGIAIITLSFILHMITAIKRKEPRLLFAGEGSLLWFLVYWFTIGILVKSLVQELNIIYESIFLALLLLTIFIQMIRKTHQSTQSLIDLLREFMDTITNTLSFLRLGAFALAHGALFIAVFSIARMVSESQGESFLYWMSIILGNLVIIVLEGVVVTIQTLRLEYYEFFKRFFKGGGLPYSPYSFGGKNEN